MKRGTRDARFSVFRTFYAANKAGHMSDESVQENVKFAGFNIYESELDKFTEEFPDIDASDFKEWLLKFDLLKAAKAKSAGGGKGRLSLNTIDKAKSVGVSDENVDRYIALMEQMFALRTELQSIVPVGTVTITIPIREKKEKEKDA